MEDIQKIQLGNETLAAFIDNFGADVYGQILLEVLLEGIINEEAVFIFGEQEQTGNQINNSSSGEQYNNEQIDGFIHTETSTDVGTQDTTNHS